MTIWSRRHACVMPPRRQLRQRQKRHTRKPVLPHRQTLVLRHPHKPVRRHRRSLVTPLLKRAARRGRVPQFLNRALLPLRTMKERLPCWMGRSCRPSSARKCFLLSLHRRKLKRKMLIRALHHRSKPKCKQSHLPPYHSWPRHHKKLPLHNNRLTRSQPLPLPLHRSKVRYRQYKELTLHHSKPPSREPLPLHHSKEKVHRPPLKCHRCSREHSHQCSLKNYEKNVRRSFLRWYLPLLCVKHNTPWLRQPSRASRRVRVCQHELQTHPSRALRRRATQLQPKRRIHQP